MKMIKVTEKELREAVHNLSKRDEMHINAHGKTGTAFVWIHKDTGLNNKGIMVDYDHTRIVSNNILPYVLCLNMTTDECLRCYEIPLYTVAGNYSELYAEIAELMEEMNVLGE